MSGALQICTMTVGSHYHCRVNHYVLSRYFPLDELFREVSYYEYHRRWVDGAVQASVEPKASYFQSQTTLLCQQADHKVNLKLFDNGNLLMVGCKSLAEAQLILTQLTERLQATWGTWHQAIDWQHWNANFVSLRKAKEGVEEQWLRGVKLLDPLVTFESNTPKKERWNQLDTQLRNNKSWMNQALAQVWWHQMKGCCADLSWEEWVAGIQRDGNWSKERCAANALNNRWEPDPLTVNMINCAFSWLPCPSSSQIREWIKEDQLLILYPEMKRGPSIIECDWAAAAGSSPVRICFYCGCGKINISAKRSWEELQAVHARLVEWLGSRRVVSKQELTSYQQMWVSADGKTAYWVPV
jgi:hypothetical protein